MACLGLLTLCVGLAGCSSLGKKTAQPNAGDGRTTANPRDDRSPLAQVPSGPAGDVGGMLAGRVVDNFSNTPYSDIWVVGANDGRGAPVARRVETDRQGYFTILNLQAGQAYRLIAQTKEGAFKEAGEITVRPPNARVIIPVSQDRTPAIPGGGGQPSPPSIGQPVPLPPSGGAGRGGGPAADIGQPVPLVPSGSEVPVRPENIADGVRQPRDSKPATIPGPRGIPAPPAPLKPAPPAGSGGGPPLPEPLSPVGVTPVPSCDLRGRQLVNFALAGRDGQPWEYKRDRLPGTRVMLLDFWGTWCLPCRATIRNHLNRLNDWYGRQGLEIIGIAYEREPTFPAQVRTVDAAVRQLGIKYRLLMGRGDTCPVKVDFGVEGLPTLVLLNDKGQIIWTHKGMPSDAEFEQLKVIVRQQLGIR
jgi:thiol-disulfide isomerase/thioredoxin